MLALRYFSPAGARLLNHDRKNASSIRIAGVDEAGRGALAGPVMAAAVMLDPAAPIPGVGDSKQIAPARRRQLALEIKGHAIAWHVAEASVEEITQLNVLNATLLAMYRAVVGLTPPPALARIDGNAMPPLPCEGLLVVGGDHLFADIGAASILAKVTRDAYLERLDLRYPGYGFARHKGYGTKVHLAALDRLGPTPCHRSTFAPVRQALAEHRGQGLQ